MDGITPIHSAHTTTRAEESKLMPSQDLAFLLGLSLDSVYKNLMTITQLRNYVESTKAHICGVISVSPTSQKYEVSHIT